MELLLLLQIPMRSTCSESCLPLRSPDPHCLPELPLADCPLPHLHFRAKQQTFILSFGLNRIIFNEVRSPSKFTLFCVLLLDLKVPYSFLIVTVIA